MMDYLTEFSEIRFLLGYFHQYWSKLYSWEGNNPTFQPIIRLFKTENSSEIVERLVFEIERFLMLPLNDEEFERVLVEEIGCEYTPRSQGLNERQFLEQILEILKEPMEKTKQGFIPEFIG